MAYIWTYLDVCDRWHFVSARDQVALESAYDNISTTPVSVLGGRCDACLQTRTIKTVYSERVTSMPLIRASWFANGLPYSEEDAEAITTFSGSPLADTSPLQLKDKQIYKDSAGNLMESPGIILMPPIPLVRVENGTIDESRIIKDVDEDTSRACSHLILCVHGIGESMWTKKAFNVLPFEEGCATFRQILGDFGQESHTRIEVLPIEWFHIFSQSDCAKRITDITLPTVPLIRQFANGALSDVIFYLDPAHKERVLHHVGKRISEILTTFESRNPGFNGKLSLIGHSLGSVICYDLLASNHVMDNITVNNLFLFGSPLSMFLTARNHSSALSLKHSGSLYNIFQPHDPVAYRIEPLINPLLRAVEPAWIPSYATGGIMTQTKLRQATSSLWSIFTKTDSDDVKVPLTVRIQQVITGNTAPLGDTRVSQAVEDLVNANHSQRIDWSVQVGFMPTEYATAISAHVSYFADKDVGKFVFTKSI